MHHFASKGEYWLEQAKEIRRQVVHATDPVAKRNLASVAATYEDLARQALSQGARNKR
jgi:hypothetical protein